MLTTVAAGRMFDYSYCIGMYGESGIEFLAPVDFAFGSNGIVYAVNRGAEQMGLSINACTFGVDDHEFLGQLAVYGSGDGEVMWPVSIDVDQEENLYISDEYLQRITIVGKEGKFLGKWGSPGSGDGELNGPSGLAFDGEDNLYVVDSLNNRIQKFTREGKFLGKWGRQGSGDGEFNMPWGICVDRVGDVYVADWKNGRVQKFSPDGQFLGRFGGTESGVGALERPSGVAVDSEGDVYVTDWGAHVLQIYAADGAFIASLVGDAQQPSHLAQTYINANPDMVKARRRANLEVEWRFGRPVAVNVDAEDRIFVLEATRHRIQVYNKVRDFEEHPLNL